MNMVVHEPTIKKTTNPIQVMWAIGMSRLIVLIQMEKITMGNVQTVPYCKKV